MNGHDDVLGTPPEPDPKMYQTTGLQMHNETGLELEMRTEIVGAVLHIFIRNKPADSPEPRPAAE